MPAGEGLRHELAPAVQDGVVGAEGAGGEDPDIAGIVPGPQPLPEEWGESEEPEREPE